MKKAFCALLAAGLCLSPAATAQSGGDIILATTTSVRDAGLLDVLLPPFEAGTGLEVKAIAVGSGQAMELGRRGEADILILHDPAGEERFVRDGYGTDRIALMHNSFVLAGPPSDPAAVRGRANIADAFRAIADARSRFISRGDNSGTHVKELVIWSAAGGVPDEDWYWESGQGMSSTLQIASEVDGYVLTDIGTFLRHSASGHLENLFSGDSLLFNPYHVILVTGDRTGHGNPAGARALHEYLQSGDARAIIRGYGAAEFGRPLFRPDTESSPR